jgi:hypothetical protein
MRLASILLSTPTPLVDVTDDCLAAIVDGYMLLLIACSLLQRLDLGRERARELVEHG